jgi:hypothetical protein
VPEKFKTHREIGVGMNYWINSKAVLKFSYHDVHGNMLSIPRGTLDLATLNDLPVDTKLVTFGLSFVF